MLILENTPDQFFEVDIDDDDDDIMHIYKVLINNRGKTILN